MRWDEPPSSYLSSLEGEASGRPRSFSPSFSLWPRLSCRQCHRSHPRRFGGFVCWAIAEVDLREVLVILWLMLLSLTWLIANLGLVLLSLGISGLFLRADALELEESWVMLAGYCWSWKDDFAMTDEHIPKSKPIQRRIKGDWSLAEGCRITVDKPADSLCKILHLCCRTVCASSKSADLFSLRVRKPFFFV